MADVSITPAVVTTNGTISTERVTSGAAITQGQAVYIDSNDRAQLADADAVASSVAKGIALNDVDAAGQPLTVLTGGTLDITLTNFTVGETYVVSTTAGGIAPYSDLGSGDFVCILGVASTTARLPLNIRSTRAAKA